MGETEVEMVGTEMDTATAEIVIIGHAKTTHARDSTKAVATMRTLESFEGTNCAARHNSVCLAVGFSIIQSFLPLSPGVSEFLRCNLQQGSIAITLR